MACKNGYYGIFCNPCPPGFYGVECAGRCSPECVDKDCNHVSGCFHGTEETTQRETVPTVRKTTHNISTSTNSVSPKTKIVTVSKESPTKGDINTKYILAGGGILLLLILVVIVLQLYTYTRSKSTQSKNLKRKKCDEIEQSDEFADVAQVQKEDEFASSSEHEAMKKNNSNQPVDSDYHDIESFSELKCSPDFSNASQDYEKAFHLPKNNLSYSPVTNRLNDQQSEPGPSQKYGADIYLQPINV